MGENRARIASLLMMISGVCLLGCHTEAIRYVAAPSAPSTMPVPPAQVRVVALSGEDWSQQLPPGLMRAVGGQDLRAVPAYPSAANPHVILGMVSGPYRHGGTDEVTIAGMRETAARNGATALFLIAPDRPHYPPWCYRSCSIAVAVRLSDDSPPQWPEARAALAGAQVPEEYRPLAGPSPFDLGATLRGTLRGSRGTCYGLAVAMDTDAEFSDDVWQRGGISADVREAEGTVVSLGLWSPAGPHERHYYWNLGCAQTDGELEYRVRAPGGALGRGRGLSQVFVRPARAGELQQRAEARRRGIEAAHQAVCERCREHYDACLWVQPSSRAEECRPFVSCMGSVPMSECRFAR